MAVTREAVQQQVLLQMLLPDPSASISEGAPQAQRESKWDCATAGASSLRKNLFFDIGMMIQNAALTAGTQ